MKTQIDFLNVLFKKLHCRQEILEHLAAEKVIPATDVQDIMLQGHNVHAQQIAAILKKAVQEEKLQLADYEWTMLPVERLLLTIVSANSKKEWRA